MPAQSSLSRDGERPMTGRTLGNYLLLEEIGRGGMGAVYRARDTRLDRIVAVKLLPQARIDDEARRRFLHEAKALSALNDPGIVILHDIGSDGPTDFLVMEYVEGPTLARVLTSGRLPVRQAVQYAECIARAVAAAHALGIVHRDLKPGNVIVKPSGDLKVLDFGVAKLARSGELSDETRTAVTQAGSTIGTPYYMSPEQAAGEHVDHRSDIFSLGVVLYEMLAGGRPFAGSHTAALLHAIHYEKPRPISPSPPAAVWDVVTRALAKEPSRRFPTMVAFAAALHKALDELDSGRMGAFAVRRALKRAGVGLLALALIVAAAVGVRHYATGAASKPAAVTTSRAPHELVSEARQLLNRADVPANVDKAIALLRSAAQTYPDHAASHASLALSLTLANNGSPSQPMLREAEDHAGRAVSLDPQLALAHVAVGGCHYAARRYPEAQRELTEAVNLDPGNSQAHLLLGALHYRLGNFERSQQEYQEAVRLAPADFEARIGHAAILYHQGSYKDAESESLAAVRLAPDSPRPHQMLGSMYYAQGNLDAAARSFQTALEIQPTARAYSNLGTVYFFREMYQQSAAAFEKATRLQPDRYLYWGNLGDCYRWMPDGRQRSVEAYTRAIDLARAALKPGVEDLETRSRLAVLLAKRGDSQAARQEITRVEQSKAEKTGPLHYRSAIAYEVIGEREKALAALARAVQANYSFDEIRRDPELKRLRDDPRYARLAASARK